MQSDFGSVITKVAENKKNITVNLTQGKFNPHDRFCGQSPNFKCDFCGSLESYLNDGPFVPSSEHWKGFILVKETSNVSPFHRRHSRLIVSDNFTQTLIMSDLMENSLLQNNIPHKFTFGTVCNNIGIKYSLIPQTINFKDFCLTEDLIRPLDENKLITSRPDGRIPFKVSTIQTLILNLLEIFKAAEDAGCLLGFLLCNDLSFQKRSRKITLGSISLDGRFSCLFSVPAFSSALITINDNGNNKKILISTNLPMERSEAMYFLHDSVISTTDSPSHVDFFRIVNWDKFAQLMKTGLIPFNIGNSFCLSLIILSFAIEYPFIATMLSDPGLCKFWNFLWHPSDLDSINSRIVSLLDSQPLKSEDLTQKLCDILSKVHIRKNMINQLITYLPSFI